MTLSAVLDAARGSDLGRRRSKQGRSRSLWRPWRGHEPIHMIERRHGYFPKLFAWRGRRYDVYAVERCWTVSRAKLGGRVERYCFRVRCTVRAARVRARSQLGDLHTEAKFEIYQDVRENTWHMLREVD